ncbi:hypothetical protein CALCODRAFT_491683 [Calocera cornea HHB12733]|uniref:F-box domain-containing protein n=1 Tax=Calocera cornea HHB12733 TaxID=1353952 RepID=A0A165IVE6_9BASI|nr:hypothetical protein CALCODRAFT_491683 [Calocera cornea HHB12733]
MASTSTIPRVPEDVWRPIFLFAAGESTASRERIALRLGAVCRCWRDIVLDSPDLWTSATAFMVLGKRDAWAQREHLSLVLERARNRNVEVLLVPDPGLGVGLSAHRLDPDLLALLVQHMHHISRLDINTTSPSSSVVAASLQGFNTFIKVKDSGLEELSLNGDWSAAGTLYGVLHLLQVSKRLRTLAIRGVARGLQPGAAAFIREALVLPALQTLAVSHHLLKWLSTRHRLSMPVLKSLAITGGYAYDREVLDTLRTIPPSLEELRLEGCESGDTLFVGLSDKRLLPNLKKLGVDMGTVGDDALVSLLKARADPPTFTVTCHSCQRLTVRGWKAMAKARMQQDLYLYPPSEASASSSSETDV